MGNEKIIYEMGAKSNRTYKIKALICLIIIFLCFIINTIISLSISGSFEDQFTDIMEGYIAGFIIAIIAFIFFIVYLILLKIDTSGIITLTDKRIYCRQTKGKYELSIFLNHIVSVQWSQKRIIIRSVGPVIYIPYDEKMYQLLISLI